MAEVINFPGSKVGLKRMPLGAQVITFEAPARRPLPLSMVAAFWSFWFLVGLKMSEVYRG